MAGHSVKPSQLPNILYRLAQRQFSGCLQITAEDTAWCFYLKDGEFIYATKLSDALRRLRHILSRISEQQKKQVLEQSNLIPDSNLEEQLSIYEEGLVSERTVSPDYQIICWLTNQRYLDQTRASVIVQTISEDAIASLAQLEIGNCQVVPFPPTFLLQKIIALDIADFRYLCQQPLIVERSYPSTNSFIQKNSQINNQPNDNHLRPVSPHKTQKYVIGCVDDSLAVLNSLKKCLDSAKFTVFTVNNPVKALMTIIRNHPDLIILDVMMPGIDGYELCSLLRKHPKFHKTPIVIITSNMGLVDRAKVKQVEASGYLNKPFTKAELLQVVGDYLD